MKFDFVSFSLIYTNKVEGTVVVEELVDAIGRSELCTKFGDGCGWGIGYHENRSVWQSFATTQGSSTYVFIWLHHRALQESPVGIDYNR
jgi:hypothetical protein